MSLRSNDNGMKHPREEGSSDENKRQRHEEWTKDVLPTLQLMPRKDLINCLACAWHGTNETAKLHIANAVERARSVWLPVEDKYVLLEHDWRSMDGNVEMLIRKAFD